MRGFLERVERDESVDFSFRLRKTFPRGSLGRGGLGKIHGRKAYIATETFLVLVPWRTLSSSMQLAWHNEKVEPG